MEGRGLSGQVGQRKNVRLSGAQWHTTVQYGSVREAVQVSPWTGLQLFLELSHASCSFPGLLARFPRPSFLWPTSYSAMAYLQAPTGQTWPPDKALYKMNGLACDFMLVGG